jgi:FMN phosphatase YigB (HAD superfamily)
MKKIIIFDFTRTIYDPENDRIIPGTKFVLRTLLRRGFTLYLVSSAGRSRKKWIDNLIGEYFSKLIVRQEKAQRDFERLVMQKNVDREKSFIIGDRRDIEISIGNSLGVQTIWIKTGNSVSRKLTRKVERPTHTVKTLREVLSVAC